MILKDFKTGLIGLQSQNSTILAAKFNFNSSNLKLELYSEAILNKLLNQLILDKKLTKQYSNRNEFLNDSIDYDISYIYVRNAYWIYTDGVNLSSVK